MIPLPHTEMAPFSVHKAKHCMFHMVVRCNVPPEARVDPHMTRVPVVVRSAHHKRQHSLMRISRKNKLDDCFYNINVMCQRHNCLFLEHSRDETVHSFVSSFRVFVSFLSLSDSVASRIIHQ